MTLDIEAMMEAHRSELREPAATLLAVQQLYGDNVRDQTIKAYGRLNDAHLLINGVLGAGLLRINGKITEATQIAQERNALFASFVIGMNTCENAIAEGRYLQGLTLLRQEMETLAQLKAVAAGQRRGKKTPNVKALEGSIARLYGDLCAAAHLSQHHMIRSVTEWQLSSNDLPGPTGTTRYFPAFDEGLARRSFSLHLMLTMGLVEEFGIDLHHSHSRDAFSQREGEALHLALVLMACEGMVEIDPVQNASRGR
jgi:hypothetical protein